MRIGIDARPLQHETQYRGIGKSLEFLLLALNDGLKKSDQILFYVDEGLPRPKLLEGFKNSEIKQIPTSRLGRKRYFRSFMQSFRTISPNRGEADVILQYDAGFGVPKQVPTVVIFHDLIPYLFRGQEKKRPVKAARQAKDALARNMYWRKYLRTLERYQDAAQIIAISESSKRDLLEYIKGVKAEKVIVIGHGLNVLEAGGDIRPAISRLTHGPYLMYAGGVDIRKNIIGLLETFIELKPHHPELKLVMVGKEFELKDRLEDLGWFTLLSKRSDLAKDVILPGFVSSAELAFIYQNASALVFPSRYEGFGLPVLEAMGAGCPVIAYDNSSIPEVAGGAAILVPDGQPLTLAAERVLNDSVLREELITKGRRQAKKFSWDKTASDILAVLRRTAN